ncbi:MAG: AAA family ATPase [Bacteroidota bacterium]
MKTLREDAIRQLQDRTELFVDGENIIRFGRHQFSVNTQTLDLTIVPRKDEMCVHLTGTNFFEAIDDEDFVSTRSVWSQSLISENQSVYRAEYLAWRMLSWLQQPDSMSMDAFQVLDAKEMEQQVRDFMSRRFEEGYVKGIHDHDAALLLSALAELHGNIELLRFTPEARACAQLFWLGYIGETEKNLMLARLKGAGEILQLFPNTQEFGSLIDDIAENMRVFLTMTELFDEKLAESAADYLFHELALGESFVVSKEAADLHKAFLAYLKKKKFTTRFNKALDALKEASADRYELIRTWLRAFVESNGGENPFAEEAAALVFRGGFEAKEVVNVSLHTDIKGLVGEHAVIEEGKYTLDYHAFVAKMKAYDQEVVPLFKTFTEEKSRLLTEYRESLRLESFRPRVLTSFVRNQLIDKLYLPIIGDNLAKQMGTVGDQTRTDRMGLLLLISPPGYGKTTLMEYVANRLGLIFMKVNGPAIGHQVTSLDPVEAPNAAAREELAKLNLALEMGDNVMLYVDDIQHCHPEFLQKFISLCDAQRKIEGVYKGKTRTYDLRGKKVAVVMAGNPYTESGEKFQIPDMLANRADTYNLGDIIGDSADLFKLSYIENSLTSNQVLSRMSSMPREDVLAIIEMAEGKRELSADLSSNLSGEELQEMHTVLQKLFVIRDVILNVNQAYIKSAGQEDLFRTEPPFLLQGSYRNMNKLVEKVAPIMNNQELETLILSHYEGESQTLTSGAEANMIRFKEMNGFASDNDATRWEEICRLYREQKSLSADKLSQLVREMGSFSEGLKGIQEALEKGISRNGSEKGESLK